MTRRLSLALVVFLGGTALLVAPTMSAPAADTPRGGTLRVSRFSDVDFVDPALAYYPWSWEIGYATCAKLFNYPDAAGAAGTRLVPEVVDRHSISRDGRTYTFELKRTFRFNTGAAVTAQSFADAFNRAAQPKLGSPATHYMGEIEGAAAVIDGKATSISGIRVLGRHRLQIRLTRPLGDLTARLTLPFFCPVLPNTAVDPAGIDNPAGSGPYYVAERIVNQRIVLKRNPYYRGNRPANVDQVVWEVGRSREECQLAVEQDRLDYCSQQGLETTAYRALAEKFGVNRPGGQYFVHPGLTTWFVAFNHDRPAFRGPGQIPLKKAINLALDRPAMTRAFGHLAGKRTDQTLPPALARRASIYPLAGANVAAARSWYAKARLKPSELVLYASGGATGVVLAHTLAFNLKQIGIDVEVKYYDSVTLDAKRTTEGEPFDLTIFGWVADYADAASFFLPLLGPGSREAGTNFERPTITARLQAANRLTGEARRKAWADLDVELMRSDPPWAPFAHTQRRTFVSRSVGCVVDHPVYGFDLVTACKR
jgi:ABC-type oligopeptide transport system substrate-binding subunit